MVTGLFIPSIPRYMISLGKANKQRKLRANPFDEHDLILGWSF
jgi:hypothetical protein